MSWRQQPRQSWSPSTAGKGSSQVYNRPTSQKSQTWGGSQPQKRTPSAAPNHSGNDAKRTKTGKISVLVHSSAKQDELGLQTLVGEYVEHGMNHNRKTFKKAKMIESSDDDGPTHAFLYYWDERDGNEFSGWWFGDEVGGSQVWAKASSKNDLPPKQGWRVPHDGEVSRELKVEVQGASPGGMRPKEEAPEEDEQPWKKAKVVPPPVTRSAGSAGSASSAVIKKAVQEVEKVEEEARQKIGDAKQMLEGAENSRSSLSEAHDLLQRTTERVNSAQDALVAEIKKQREGDPVQKQLQSLMPRLKSIRVKVLTESARAKAQLSRKKKHDEEEESRQKSEKETAQQEIKDAKTLEETLPGILEAVGASESAVESAMVAAEPLNGEIDLGNELEPTLENVEKAAKDAQNAVNEARGKLKSAQQTAKRFAPEARRAAEKEFRAIWEKVEAAQKKIGPLKRAKQEHEERIAVRKVLDECMEKVGDAEVEIEKLDIDVASLSTGDTSEEEIKKAQTRGQPAREKQTAAMKFVQEKMRDAKGMAKTDFEQFLERCTKNQERLTTIGKNLKELRYKKAADECVQKVTDLTPMLDEANAKCSEAEMPFLKGIEILPKEEAAAALEASQTAANTASEVIKEAKAFMQAKNHEVKKYTPEAMKNCQDALGELQKKVDSAFSKLQAFRKDMAQRQNALTVQEVTAAVTEAESQVEAGSEIAKALSDGKIAELSPEEIKEVCAKAAAAEKEANKIYVNAGKLLKSKQGGSDLGPEQVKLQKRLAAVKDGLYKLRKAASSGERVIKNREILVEAEAKLSVALKEIEKADTMATPVGDENLKDDQIAAVTEVLDAASKLITTASKYIGQQMNEQEGPREALGKLKTKAKKGHETLTELKNSTREQRERVQGQKLVQEGTEKVVKAEEALESTTKAEEPFLKGIEAIPLAEATPALEASNAGVASASGIASMPLRKGSSAFVVLSKASSALTTFSVPS
eukprot:gnl/MRDRNA2_/MRDRNA2_108125_c0_seq1.p2 gnl/MRDRNA2_/MRDRNA2_108125_c0~~gnl/MRDRNA2_/MRDRNA2_108125_c0_seq1.p2  ORF type:complete len:981 (-),score=319.19 gnl/MRDRNA2_/MRDRNA2_108125_c0_seq1:2931-5873(-)